MHNSQTLFVVDLPAHCHAGSRFMEYLVFKSAKSGNKVILPAGMAMVINRDNSTVVYAIGGNGKDRMVWELPDQGAISVVESMAALAAE